MEGTIKLENHDFAILNDIIDSEDNANTIIWQFEGISQFRAQAMLLKPTYQWVFNKNGTMNHCVTPVMRRYEDHSTIYETF